MITECETLFTHIAMQSIRKSECPKELEPADRKTAVHVNLMRKEEDFSVSSLYIPHISFFCSLPAFQPLL